jgi:nitrite reductase (NO-forming)
MAERTPFMTRTKCLGAFVLSCALAACQRAEPSPIRPPAEDVDPIEGEEIASEATAPAVPPPLTRNHATKVTLDVEIREQRGTLADGVEYPFWTYDGSAPGKFYRVREGDLVEVRLHNHPDNTFAHNIDFQSAIGPGGGGDASFVSPGYSTTFAWRALRPGLFMYECSAAPAGVHVANGMYGLILVEPRRGLPRVDREFQIVQSEFYTEGKFGERGPQRFSADKALKEQPEYVEFNGRVDSLSGVHALKARSGERVRIYFGNAGPNLTSSFHVIGEIFDDVYAEGGAVANRHNVLVTGVAAGGATIVEFTPKIGGEYPIVDHALFRSYNKGTMGTLSVEGPDNRMLFSGTTSQAVYSPGTTLSKLVDLGRLGAEGGAGIFATVCATCHQASGQGIPKVFPPLRASDFLVADRARAIRIVMSGLKGPIVVGGQTYSSIMPNPGLNDEQIAQVLSYEMTNLDNHGKPVTVDEVARVRKSWDGQSPLVATPAWAKPHAAR